MNMASSHVMFEFFVLVTSYSLNEHSSNKEPKENTNMKAYHNTVESELLPSIKLPNWISNISKTVWFGYLYDYIPLMYMN